MRLFLLFLLVPLIEIALFIQIGGIIGLGWTLAIVILTAILGTLLVRSQGLAVMNQLRGSFEELKDPTEPLAHGAMVLFSGALLLTPGFFTDALGFSLLVPGIRSAVFKWARSRVKVTTFSVGAGPQQNCPNDTHTTQGDVIDGEFTEVDPSKRPTHPPSGWTKH